MNLSITPRPDHYSLFQVLLMTWTKQFQHNSIAALIPRSRFFFFLTVFVFGSRIAGSCILVGKEGKRSREKPWTIANRMTRFIAIYCF